jgi:hypothetical protein
LRIRATVPTPLARPRRSATEQAGGRRNPVETSAGDFSRWKQHPAQPNYGTCLRAGKAMQLHARIASGRGRGNETHHRGQMLLQAFDEPVASRRISIPIEAQVTCYFRQGQFPRRQKPGFIHRLLISTTFSASTWKLRRTGAKKTRLQARNLPSIIPGPGDPISTHPPITTPFTSLLIVNNVDSGAPHICVCSIPRSTRRGACRGQG